LVQKQILVFSWKLNDHQQETIAFDKIGMCYYYLGEIRKAKFFHDKSMNADLEPISSSLRILALRELEEIYRRLDSENMTYVSVLDKNRYEVNQAVKSFDTLFYQGMLLRDYDHGGGLILKEEKRGKEKRRLPRIRSNV